jgi:phage tail-like protein
VGIYNTFNFGDGTLYGNQSKLAYSSTPFVATAIGNFNVNGVSRPKVELSWNNPQGTILGFRIVRNQNGFAEHEEDGHIILETFSPTLPTSTVIYDQMFNVPLIEGKYAYYTIWVLLADKSWYLSASDVILIPKSHNVVSPEGVELVSSEDKFVGLLPRAFTSQQGSNLDELDKNSDLYKFLGGFAYTLDEILTFADLTIATRSAQNINPNFTSVIANQFGLPNFAELNLKTQQRLIQQAIYMYQHKGTVQGLNTFIETITGYAPTITISPNLINSSQDSSFYSTSGNWIASASAALSSVSNVALTAAEPYAVDKVYCGKIITSATNQTISLGNSTPVFNGVAVTEGVSYQLSYYVNATATGGSITPTITWYDYTGTAIGSPSTGTSNSVTTSWGRKTFIATAPTGARFMGLTFTFSAAKTYYLDMIQFADSSDSRSAVYYPANGTLVYLAPSKINYLENPSFASNGDEDSDWVVVGGTTDYSLTTTVPGVLDGSHMLHVTTSGSTPFSMTCHTDVVKSGAYYTFSVYAKTGSGTAELSFSITARDSSTNVIVNLNGADVTTTVTPIPNVNSTWSRYQVSVFVPPYNGSLYLNGVVSNSTAQTGALYFDAAQIEQGYAATDYFDGDYVNRGAAWVSTPNDSESIAYPQKTFRLNLLKNNINDFLPINTPYIVTTGYDTLSTIEFLGFSS